MKQALRLVLVFLCGCSTETPWELSSLPAGEKKFDCARICYKSDNSLSGISLELYYAQGIVVGYLKSTLRRFDTEKAQIQLGSTTEEILLDLHEGHMRAKIPDKVIEKVIQTLQDGQSVSIIIGSQTQIFRPDQFSKAYHQLTQGSLL